MAEYLKPLPYADADSKPYWDYAKRHELRMQSCADCGEVRFPPRPMCPACHSMREEWVPMRGTGTIYSWIVVHQSQHPAFNPDAPYNVVIVQLDEGPRLHGNLVGRRNEEIHTFIKVKEFLEYVRRVGRVHSAFG